MSGERLVEHLAEAIERRGFLKKVGAAGVGLVAGVLGSQIGASAQDGLVPWACCTVCQQPRQCPSCACTWAWLCTTPSCTYACIECYGSTSSGCGGGCGGVICSEVDRRQCH